MSRQEWGLPEGVRFPFRASQRTFHVDPNPEALIPFYEYVCRSCATRFEAMRPMKERLTPIACPTCRNRETSLALSAPGLVGAATSRSGDTCEARPDGGCCGGACMD